jgi:hypothetical protein
MFIYCKLQMYTVSASWHHVDVYQLFGETSASLFRIRICLCQSRLCRNPEDQKLILHNPKKLKSHIIITKIMTSWNSLMFEICSTVKIHFLVPRTIISCSPVCGYEVPRNMISPSSGKQVQPTRPQCVMKHKTAMHTQKFIFLTIPSTHICLQIFYICVMLLIGVVYNIKFPLVE